MGTSLALAVQATCPNVVIDAVEINPTYRGQASRLSVFHHIYPTCDDVTQNYDMLFLAIPVHAARDLLTWGASHATNVVDLCSVKSSICTEAHRVGLTAQFVPSHPMAGKASGGPKEASATLFEGRPWLFLKDWHTPADLVRLVSTFGAKPTFVQDAQTHDEMMAQVSHGIHLTSLSAMLASDNGIAQAALSLASVAGPALWDITRLAASPAEFWVDTLLDNAAPVRNYLEHLRQEVDAFARLLQEQDRDGLSAKLAQAQEIRQQWERGRKQ